MQVGIKRKLVFPSEVAVTSFCPDVILLSKSTDQLQFRGRKHSLSLMSCKSQSIRVSRMKHILEGGMLPCVPLEVGCHGFPSSSVHHFLQKISLEPKQMKRPLEEIASTAEESSRWLWLTKDWSWNPSHPRLYAFK